MSFKSLPKPRPPSANAPLRSGVTPIISARLDVLAARAAQLTRLRVMPYERYMAALEEMGDIMVEVVAIHAAAEVCRDYV